MKVLVHAHCWRCVHMRTEYIYVCHAYVYILLCSAPNTQRCGGVHTISTVVHMSCEASCVHV